MEERRKRQGRTRVSRWKYWGRRRRTKKRKEEEEEAGFSPSHLSCGQVEEKSEIFFVLLISYPPLSLQLFSFPVFPLLSLMFLFLPFFALFLSIHLSSSYFLPPPSYTHPLLPNPFTL